MKAAIIFSPCDRTSKVIRFNRGTRVIRYEVLRWLPQGNAIPCHPWILKGQNGKNVRLWPLALCQSDGCIEGQFIRAHKARSQSPLLEKELSHTKNHPTNILNLLNIELCLWIPLSIEWRNNLSDFFSCAMTDLRCFSTLQGEESHKFTPHLSSLTNDFPIHSGCFPRFCMNISSTTSVDLLQEETNRGEFTL